MTSVSYFNFQDLEKIDLEREANAGRFSVITNQGNPSILAVPFDQDLLGDNVFQALALHSFQTGVISMGQAAKMLKMSLQNFMGFLTSMNMDVVDYDPEDLDQELTVLNES